MSMKRQIATIVISQKIANVSLQICRQFMLQIVADQLSGFFKEWLLPRMEKLQIKNVKN
jgi:hypothetical protein